METKGIGTFALFILCVIGFASCSNDDGSQDKVEVVEAVISPYTRLSSWTMSSTIVEGMSVKLGSSDEYQYLAMGAINGFNFDGGYEYSVQLQRTTLANPPADGSVFTYKLLKVNSKEDKAESRTEIKLYVSAETGEFKCGDITQDMPSKGIKYRENESDEWSVGPFNRINGFDYEIGYNYVLLVEKTILPKQDTYYYYHPVQYRLIEIVSKEN